MGKKASLFETPNCNFAQGRVFSRKDLQKKMPCSKTAIDQAIARFQNFGLYHDKKRRGKPRRTSPYDDNLIRRIAVLSPTSSRPENTWGTAC